MPRKAGGIEGVPFSARDLQLSRLRYEEYIRRTKKNKHLPFDVAIKDLPRSGATILPCGCNRFDHVVIGACFQRKASSPDRCLVPSCAREKSHPGKHRPRGGQQRPTT